MTDECASQTGYQLRPLLFVLAQDYLFLLVGLHLHPLNYLESLVPRQPTHLLIPLE